MEEAIEDCEGEGYSEIGTVEVEEVGVPVHAYRYYQPYDGIAAKGD